MNPTQEYPLFLAQAGKAADRRQTVTSTYLTVKDDHVGIVPDIKVD